MTDSFLSRIFEQQDDSAIHDIARVCHEANRAWCLSQGDRSQLAWEDTDEDTRASAIDGVKFLLAHPEATEKDIHDNWVRFKQRNGDRDPDMIPYHELTEFDRSKDSLFLGIVRSLQGVI